MLKRTFMLAACPAFENYITINPCLCDYSKCTKQIKKYQIALGKCGHLCKILSIILFCKS